MRKIFLLAALFTLLGGGNSFAGYLNEGDQVIVTAPAPEQPAEVKPDEVNDNLNTGSGGIYQPTPPFAQPNNVSNEKTAACDNIVSQSRGHGGNEASIRDAYYNCLRNTLGTVSE